MSSEYLFDEDGVMVDENLVRVGTTSVKIRDITKLHSQTYRTDGHVAPVIWSLAFVALIFWIAAPTDNAFMLFLLIPLVLLGLHKHSNPSPARHRVMLGTGSLLNTLVLDSTDEDQALRLREVIESLMSTT